VKVYSVSVLSLLYVYKHCDYNFFAWQISLGWRAWIWVTVCKQTV